MNKRIARVLILAAGLSLASWTCALANDPPVVTNVTASQQQGSTLVDISYDVEDPDSDVLWVSAVASADGGVTYTIPVQSTSQGSDIGAGVTSGTGKHIVWDAGVDYPDGLGDDFVVRVTACDSSELDMVLVPAGSFIMGDGAAPCGVDEREITLTRDFYLGQHEVTNQEYLEAVQWAHDHGYVTATTSSVRDNLDGSTVELLDLDDPHCEIAFSGGVFSLVNPDHPVIEITWSGAARYCDWLSLMSGLSRAYAHSGDWSCNGGDPYGASGYRLPTDAEWEYAAQDDAERVYPWGSEPPSCVLANYSGCVGWTSPVGSCPAGDSALGLSDMAGNVFELCNEWRVCELGTLPATDPVGPGSGSTRVLHGGSWESGDSSLRCAARNHTYPSTSNQIQGLRVARTIDP